MPNTPSQLTVQMAQSMQMVCFRIHRYLGGTKRPPGIASALTPLNIMSTSERPGTQSIRPDEARLSTSGTVPVRRK
jgi:hypothetical protein